MFRDINGKLSGKRIGAFLLIMVGAFVAIWGVIAATDMLGVASIVSAITAPAGVLLGVTVKERNKE